MPQDLTNVNAAGTPAPLSKVAVLGLGANIEATDIKLPRIEMTQALSATVQDGTHKQGVLINSITKQELPSPVTIIPVFVTKNAILWRPRAEGGGIVYKTDDFSDPKVQDDIAWHGQEKPKATLYLNVVCRVVGEDMPLVASFCNTSFKAGSNLLSMIALSGTAWNYTYVLTPQKTQNSQGTFFKLDVKMGKATTPEQRASALQLYKQVSTVKIDTDYEGDTATDAATETPRPENINTTNEDNL